MRRLAIMFAALASSACVAQSFDEAHSPSEAPLIQFRLVEDEQAARYESVECDGDTLYVRRQAVVSDRDLRSVHPYERQGGLLLDIRLTSQGANRLRSATTAHIGKRLAFSVGSLVCSAAVIRTEVGGAGFLTVSLDVTEEKAERIVPAVRTKWPAPDDELE